MNSSDPGDDGGDGLSRRRFIQFGAALGGAALLGGCGSDDSKAGSPTTTANSVGSVSYTHLTLPTT